MIGDEIFENYLPFDRENTKLSLAEPGVATRWKLQGLCWALMAPDVSEGNYEKLTIIEVR